MKKKLEDQRLKFVDRLGEVAGDIYRNEARLRDRLNAVITMRKLLDEEEEVLRGSLRLAEGTTRALETAASLIRELSK